MRPHEGVGQSMAHVSISTTVVTHTLTFHETSTPAMDAARPREPVRRAGSQLRPAPTCSPRTAALVASFVQENMIRDFPEGQAPAAGQKAAH